MGGRYGQALPEPTPAFQGTCLREVATVIYLLILAALGLLGVGWVLGMWTRQWTRGVCPKCSYDLVCAYCLNLTQRGQYESR